MRKRTLYMNPLETLIFKSAMTTLIEDTTVKLSQICDKTMSTVWESFKTNCELFRDSVRESSKGDNKHIVTVDYASLTTMLIPALETELEMLNKEYTSPEFIDAEDNYKIKIYLTNEFLKRCSALPLVYRNELN